MTWNLVTDLAFTGNASAPNTPGGNIGTTANWSGGYAPYQDIADLSWSIVSGVLTPAVAISYQTQWALRPASEDAQNSQIDFYTPPIASGDDYVFLLRANRTNHTAVSFWYQQGSGLYIRVLTGSGLGSSVQTGFVGTVGHSYILTGNCVTVSAGVSTYTLSIADATAPGTVLATVSLTNDSTSYVQGAGSAGVTDYIGTSRAVRIRTYTQAPVITFTTNPTSAIVGSPVSITATGANTAWTNATTFSVAGGTGASISGVNVNTGAQTATFTLTPGSAAGNLTISNNTDSVTATITVTTRPTSLTPGALGIAHSTANSISFTIAAPSGGTAPYSALVYGTSPIQPGFVPPAAGALIGTQITSFPATFTDNAPGSVLKEYKVLYSDSSAGSPITGVSEPVFGQVSTGPDLVIGFIGDSFDTQAPGFETSPQTCCNRIAQLSGRNVTCVDQGASGQTSQSWQPGGGLYPAAKAAFQAAGVTHILVRLGINDASTLVPSMPAATYQTNMQNIVTQLQNDFPGVPIQLDFHSTPTPDAWKGQGGIYWPEVTALALLLQYQLALQSIVSTSKNVKIGDTSSWKYFAQHTDLLADGLHPGADGMLALAEFGAIAFLNNFLPGWNLVNTPNPGMLSIVTIGSNYIGISVGGGAG